MPPCRRLRTRSGRRATSCWSCARSRSARTPSSAGRCSTSSTGRSTGSTHRRRPAARSGVLEADGSEQTLSFAELSARSNRVANWLRELGVGRGDRLILMLGNQVELWETILAAMKLGAVIIPATTLLGAGRPGRPRRARERASRGRRQRRRVQVRRACRAITRRIAVGEPVAGWHSYADAAGAPDAFTPDGPTHASDPLLLYFTSGTTAKPKLVEHTHASYPVGHLSTMYWIGLQPGDVHLEHLVARAGRSTRGRASSRPGTPRRRCSSSTTSASTRRRLLDRDGATRA